MTHTFKVVTSDHLQEIEKLLNDGFRIDRVTPAGDRLVYVLSKELL